jgi:hypothetical protein
MGVEEEALLNMLVTADIRPRPATRLLRAAYKLLNHIVCAHAQNYALE